MSASIHSRRRTSMNDARRKEIQRAVTLIGEAMGILEVALSQEQGDYDNMPEDLKGDKAGQRGEEVIDALEGAAMGCRRCDYWLRRGDNGLPMRCARNIGSECWANDRSTTVAGSGGTPNKRHVFLSRALH